MSWRNRCITILSGGTMAASCACLGHFFRPSPPREHVASRLVSPPRATPLEEGLLITPSRVWELGEVGEGRFRQTFVVENRFEKAITPLIKTDCSCTRIMHWPSKIRPGDEGEIELEIDTVGLASVIHKKVVLSVAEYPTYHTLLEIKGNMTDGTLRCRPEFLDLGLVDTGQTAHASFEVFTSGNIALRDCYVRSNHPDIAVRLIPREEDDSRASVEVVYRPSHYPETVHASAILGAHRGPQVFREVHLFAGSVGSLRFEPRELVLGRIRRGQRIHKYVSVESLLQEPVKVKAVEAALPAGLSIVCRQNSEKNWTLTIDGRCRAPAGAALRGYISLLTTAPDGVNPRIPVLGVVGDP